MKTFGQLGNKLIKQIRLNTGIESDKSLKSIKDLRRYKYYLISSLSCSHEQLEYCNFILNAEPDKQWECCNTILDHSILENHKICYDDYEEKTKELLIEHDNYGAGTGRGPSSQIYYLIKMARNNHKGAFGEFSNEIYNEIKMERDNYLEECRLVLEEIKEVDEQFDLIKEPSYKERKSIVEEIKEMSCR